MVTPTRGAERAAEGEPFFGDEDLAAIARAAAVAARCCSMAVHARQNVRSWHMS